MKRLSPYTSHEDARGRFTGITNQRWHEVNLVETAAGEVRGNHYHRHTLELFYIVSGEVEISVEGVKTGRKTRFTAKRGDVFLIEPFELHTFRTLSDTVWLNMLDPALDPEDMDFHRPDETAGKS